MRIKKIIVVILMVFLFSPSILSFVNILTVRNYSLFNFIEFTDYNFHKYNFGYTTSVMNYIERHSQKDDVFMVFRPSDFSLYANRKFFSHYDPEFIDLFKETSSVAKIHDLLVSKNVAYLYIPSYYPPAIYDSKFIDYLSDLDFVDLVFDDGSFKLFKLQNGNSSRYVVNNTIALNELSFSNDYKDFDLFKHDKSNILTNSFNFSEVFDLRNTNAIAYTGKGNMYQYNNTVFNIKKNEHIYGMNLKYSGSGFVTAEVAEFDIYKNHIGNKFLFTSHLKDSGHIKALYKPSDNAEFYKYLIKKHDSSVLELVNIKNISYTNSVFSGLDKKILLSPVDPQYHSIKYSNKDLDVTFSKSSINTTYTLHVGKFQLVSDKTKKYNTYKVEFSYKGNKKFLVELNGSNSSLPIKVSKIWKIKQKTQEFISGFGKNSSEDNRVNYPEADWNNFSNVYFVDSLVNKSYLEVIFTPNTLYDYFNEVKVNRSLQIKDIKISVLRDNKWVPVDAYL